MKGKLIIIEAGDGCGKATQTNLLYERLLKEHIKVKKIEYPDYESKACIPVKMYLNGEFGGHVEDVNAYAASVLFAVDRYASYRMKWKQDYDEGTIILADRYTTSNMVHQAVKIVDEDERNEFLQWLWDTEFTKMGLPVPDKVIFLDLPPAISKSLIDERSIKQHRKKDIHEKDSDYLKRCYDVYKDMAKRYGWDTISCAKDNQIKTVEEIHEDIWQHVKSLILK